MPEKNHDGKCLFCQVTEQGDIIVENDLAFVISDKYPVSLGHMLIILKRHVIEYFDLSNTEVIAVNDLLKICKEQLLEDDKNISGFNVGVNCGEVAGQTIGHCHVHLIPRRKGDVSNPRGGVRGVIPEKKAYG